jgi:alpha-L-fucosidase
MTTRGARPPDVDRTQWFSEARFGIGITWGLFAIPARGESVQHAERMPSEEYARYAREFHPSRYQAKRWAALAKRAGCRYALFSAKHHDGFCMFESAVTDFHIHNTPARRDTAVDFVDAFRTENLKVGFLYSLIDWHHADHPITHLHPSHGVQPPAQARELGGYVAYVQAQVHELLQRYGRIDLLWFDPDRGTLSGEAWNPLSLIEQIRAEQPHIMVNDGLVDRNDPRWRDCSCDVVTCDHAMGTCADGWRAWEARVTLNNHAGYARDDREYKNAAYVIRLLVECVSKGGNLQIAIGPTALGEIPEPAERILSEVGAWLDRNGASIYGCGDAGLPKPEWGRLTRSGNRIYAHIFDRPAGALMIPGLAGRVARARLLADGSEVSLSPPWNAARGSDDLYLHLPLLPDAIDTVVSLEPT